MTGAVDYESALETHDLTILEAWKAEHGSDEETAYPEMLRFAVEHGATTLLGAAWPTEPSSAMSTEVAG